MSDKKPKLHQIKQPKLRAPTDQERVVRIAGLKFILPCNWKPGDVLDADTAKFLNAAHHTAVINGFAETRRVLLNNPATTYHDLDAALQAFFETYKRTTRDTTAEPKERTKRTDEERELIAYARPHFNRAIGGRGMSRKDYEAALLAYVTDNRAELERMMRAEQAALSELTATFDL